jgi:glycosyltransferase involved in cell wall biosynthesis
MGAVTFSLDERLLECLRSAVPFTTFVETGTFKGEAAALAARHLERVVTVEFSRPLWEEAVKRFEADPRVEVLLGDSREVLARVRSSLEEESTLYWLDAHWCVADDAAGEHSQCPLLEEIRAIASLGETSAILIDDARLFLAPPPKPHEVTQWPTFDEVVRALRALSGSHQLMVVNDVIAFYPRAAKAAMEGFARHHGVDWLRARQSLEENGELRRMIEEKEAVIREQHGALEKAHDGQAMLATQLDGKEAAIQDLHASIEELRAHQAAALADLATQAPQTVHELQQKEAVIQELRRALQAYRAAFSFLRFAVVPLGRLRAAARWLRGRRPYMPRPRLGILRQHPPKTLRPPPAYAASLPAAAAPRISIVTPSFHQAPFIERTIASVLDQQYPNLEYHVQDGASGDGTRDILERYAGRLSSWESTPDQGQTEAINRGFAHTTGEIMAWLNSDDILLPGALARVGDFFGRNPEVDVVYGHRILIDENDREIGRWILPRHDDKVLSWADFVPQETLFWRRALWDKAGGRVDESFRFAMDWDLLVRFRNAGARFERLPYFLGGFRIHPQQKTSAAISDVGFKEMDRIRERIHGRVPSGAEIRRALAGYLGRHVAVDLGWRARNRLAYFTGRDR